MNFRKIILLLIVFVVSAAENYEIEAYEHFMEAEYYMLNDSLDLAENYYKKALKFSPQSLILLQSMAELQIIKGEYISAINSYQSIYKFSNNKKEIGFILYDLYIQINLTADAKLILDLINSEFPDDIEILFKYISFYFQGQKWNDLLLTYAEIYKLDPERNKIIYKIYDLGIATDNLDLVKKILLDLKSVFNNPEILNLLIEISEQQGNINDSIKFINELINNNGSSNELITKLSILHLRFEDYQKVIDIIKPIYISGNSSLELLKFYLIAHSKLENLQEELNISKYIMKQYPEAQFGYDALSNAYLQLGLVDESIKLLLFAINKFPNTLYFNFSLVNIYFSLGDLLNAENYLYKILKIEPESVSAKHQLAIIFEEKKQIFSSDSLFEDIIKNNKYNSVYKNDYAYVLAERDESSNQKLQYALQLAEKAVKMEPNNAAYLDTLGWINYKLGFYIKAQEYLEKSIKINNENPVILEHLGDIYAKINKFSEAIVLYNRVLSIDTENQNIKNKINKIYE